MFDLGDFAIGNIRIARDLRRRRNGNGNRNHDARHRGDVGRRGNIGNVDVGNIDVDGNLGDVGRIDILRNVGDVGPDGNVRLRFEQPRCVVEPNVNVTHHDERRRSSRSYVGILRDQQSRGECRTRDTNAKRIAHYRQRGIEFVGTNHARGFAYDGKHCPLKQFYI